MTDVPAFLIGTSVNTVATNTTPTTNLETQPEQKQTPECENASSTMEGGRKDIFFSRGATGWE